MNPFPRKRQPTQAAVPPLKHSAVPLFTASLTIAALSLAVTGTAYGQFRASIQGTVTDPTGAEIPNATLTLVDTDTNRTTTAKSNASGAYVFNALPPDHFKLTVDAQGFQQKIITEVKVNPEQVNGLNVQMDITGTNTVVNVSGNAVQTLETETATISGNVSDNEIQHLPSAGRDVFQLLQLAPGSFGDGSRAGGGGTSSLPGTQGPGGSAAGQGSFATENGPQVVANGGQYENNGISIDGISTASAVWGGTSVITPNEDSVGSVKIVSNGYDAENGRFSGAQVQVTSKTGTNEWHGSAYFRANRPGLNAYQRYNGPTTGTTIADRGLLKDTQRFNQIGGSVGGPIIKNKLFAFFAYETIRNNSNVTSTGWYETPEFAALAPAGSISNTMLNYPGARANATSIVNTSCASVGLTEGVDCRTVAGRGLNLGSPLTSALGTQDLTWQSNSHPGIGSGLSNVPTIARYNTTNPTASTFEQYNGRLDADITPKDHAAFAIYWVPSTTTNLQGPVRQQNLWHHDQTNDAFSVIWNHIFSPSFLNEARANAAGWRYNEIGTNPQVPFGLPQLSIPAIGSITDLNYIGTPGPSNLNQWTYTYKDVATKTQGNHNIKFGGELTRLYYLNNPTSTARPSYQFFNLWSLLNDAPKYEQGQFHSTTGQPFANRQDDRENLWGFFVQDDWKARPNLTLNVGLRYSYFGSLYSKQNNMNSVVLGQGTNAFTDLTVRRGGNLYEPQKWNFGPQFGFSFSPEIFKNRVVIHGGYGLNFNQEEISITANAANNPPDVVNLAFSSSLPTSIDPRISYSIGGASTGSDSLFSYAANPNAITAFNSANLPVAGGATLTAFQRRLPTPYSHHYSLDTQMDFGHQIVGSIGFQGSSSHNIILNQQAYVRDLLIGATQNPLVNNVQIFGNYGNGNYNALLLDLKKQTSHGFMVDVQYNYARSMDDGSGPYYQDPYPYLPYLARGRSDYDVRNAFKVYGMWQPTFFGGNGWAHKIADGWTISGIFNLHTGFPWTPVVNTSGNLYYANSGYSTLRPGAYLGGAKFDTSNDAYKSGPLVGNGVNTNFPNGGLAYYTIPQYTAATGTGTAPIPQLPGVSRNSITGPGYRDVDATVTKAFGLPTMPVLGANAKIEIRADAFNLFNNLNFDPSGISKNIQNSNFGQATTALGARTVNLQARFSF